MPDAAKKAHVKPERLESWERGERRPTIRQLRELGRVYKRPLAVFYLPIPPKSFEAMHDFRRLPAEARKRKSPELMLEIRRAHQRREIAVELYRELGVSPPEFSATATPSENPEIIGHRLRWLLGITYERQIKWGDPYAAFNAWREAFETLGVLVFQARGIDVTEMRGFSISDRPLPAIVVNIKDSPRGRIFTMLHECAHIVLREGGLCDLEEDAQQNSAEQSAEVFCNEVAATTLLPTEDLLREQIVAAKGKKTQWEDDELDLLSRRYGASSEAILRRLLRLGLTTKQFYRGKRDELQTRYMLRQRRSGFAPPDVAAVSAAGPLFVRLVLNSYYQEKITSSDLSDFLDVRLKHIPSIEEAVFGNPVAFRGRP